MNARDAGTCGNPEVVSAAPNSTTAEIASVENSTLMIMESLASFIGRAVENVRGKPIGKCPQTGSDLTVPFAVPCLAGGTALHAEMKSVVNEFD